MTERRILVVCRGSQAEIIASAKSLAIDLTPYGSAKIGQAWFTASRHQKLNIAIWSLMTETPLIFHGDI